MIIHRANTLHILFGSNKNAFIPQEYINITNKNLLCEKSFEVVQHYAPLKNINFLHQTHSIQGKLINSIDTINTFSLEGDYLITTDYCTGLAIATADCLPIILYQAKPQILALIHAGWKGSLAGIIKRVISHMQEIGEISLNTLQVFIGPSAGICCYEIGQEILALLPEKIKNTVTLKKNNQLFFDLAQFNILELIRAGISKKNIIMDYHSCTICNLDYCSYRRDKTSKRQMTITYLIPEQLS